MKFFSPVFVLFMIVNSLNAQQITGTTNMHNLLYHDVPNTIYFKDIDLEKYQVSISNGEILEIKKSVLTVLIDSEYKTTVKLERKNVVKELNFRVIPFPSPKITVLTNGDGDLNNMTLEEFSSMRTAYPILENFSVDCALTVESCDVLKISSDGKRRDIKLRGSSFDSLLLKKGAKKGDVYIFTNIRVRILQTDRIVNAAEFTIYLR
ncbi:GldM family protein [uncultured Kordia sp.]|uniref:GldM family protein n=1 Tax=uncultured Kordia sp. TaxID=507699 RepID=UPI00260A0B3E|nr:GldM family protein [uncultured Kordia sp.]